MSYATDRDKLAQLIATAILGPTAPTGAALAADALVRAGYRRPRVIRAVDELDALPPGSVIRPRSLGPFEKLRDGDWYTTVDDLGAPSSGMPLPACLLYTPEEADQ